MISKRRCSKTNRIEDGHHLITIEDGGDYRKRLQIRIAFEITV
jgi:hypothetical protein